MRKAPASRWIPAFAVALGVAVPEMVVSLSYVVGPPWTVPVIFANWPATWPAAIELGWMLLVGPLCVYLGLSDLCAPVAEDEQDHADDDRRDHDCGADGSPTEARCERDKQEGSNDNQAPENEERRPAGARGPSRTPRHGQGDKSQAISGFRNGKGGA